MKADQYDSWLDPQTGPVALTIRQELQPVLGDGAVFFPPTFAAAEGSKEAPDYLIDEGVALVDTLGSRANRMEPLFKTEPYASLVPQARVRVGKREVNLLDAGHRAADALVRFSEKWSDLKRAFEDIRDRGHATMLARLAPTSIVFGAWDSRDTQAKLPRLVGSTIRAEGVRKYTRSAQFFSSFEKEEIEDLGPAKALSDVGLNHAPSGRGPGGVTALKIRRDAVLNLVALRALRATPEAESRKLQRYMLGCRLPRDSYLDKAPAQRRALPAYIWLGCGHGLCRPAFRQSAVARRPVFTPYPWLHRFGGPDSRHAGRLAGDLQAISRTHFGQGCRRAHASFDDRHQALRNPR